jgi:mannose-6-phosphate isomerase-like protein (cupin superfamily)
MSVTHSFTGTPDQFDWEGTVTHVYDKPGVRGASGKVILGPKDGAHHFVFRYFRVEPGGWTTLERHAHDHGVLILHGRGCVRLGDKEFEVGPHDLVYISPNELHQLRPLGAEPLGFLCVIPPKQKEPGQA